MDNFSQQLTKLNFSKESLLNDIEIVLSCFNNSSFNMLKTIYQKYLILKMMIQNDTLSYNPINGSVRAYLEAFNDWDNPILPIMGKLESDIDLLLKDWD